MIRSMRAQVGKKWYSSPYSVEILDGEGYLGFMGYS